MIYIILIATLLRLINLNQSLWLDEAILAQVVRHLNLKQLLTTYLPTDFNPPLIYLVELGWTKLFGFSEISLRTPSVIFGILTIWLTYKISSKLLDKKYSILPPLLLSTSGLHTYYSQEARMYSLVTLGVTGSMWAILNLLKTKKDTLSYFFFTLVAVYTHYLAWFIVPAQLIYILKTKTTILKKFILLNLAILLCYLPWISTLITQLNNGSTVSQTAWGNVIGGADLKNLSLIPIKFLIGRVTLDNKSLYLSLLVPPLTLVAFLIYKARKSIFLVSWFFIPLVLITLVSQKVPVLSYFRLLFLLPPFYILITKGLLELKSKLHYPVITFFLIINLVTTSAYLFLPKFHREDWKQLTKTLSIKTTGQPIAIIRAVSSPLEYYYPKETLDYSNLNYRQLGSEFWLIPYAQSIFNPSLTWEKQIKSQGFSKSYEQHFIGDLTLVKYTK